MITFIRRFIDEVSMIEVEIIDNDIVEFCGKERRIYNINKEKRI